MQGLSLCVCSRGKVSISHDQLPYSLCIPHRMSSQTLCYWWWSVCFVFHFPYPGLWCAQVILKCLVVFSESQSLSCLPLSLPLFPFMFAVFLSVSSFVVFLTQQCSFFLFLLIHQPNHLLPLFPYAPPILSSLFLLFTTLLGVAGSFEENLGSSALRIVLGETLLVNCRGSGSLRLGQETDMLLVTLWPSNKSLSQ